MLHPHAMTRYDRLRREGHEPADAMRETAPLFGYPPESYDAPYRPRPAVAAGGGADLDRTAARSEPSSADGDMRADAPDSQQVTPAQAGQADRDMPSASSPVTARAGGAAKPWTRDFPLPIHDVVASAGAAAQAATPGSGTAPAPPRRPARAAGHRP